MQAHDKIFASLSYWDFSLVSDATFLSFPIGLSVADGLRVELPIMLMETHVLFLPPSRTIFSLELRAPSSYQPAPLLFLIGKFIKEFSALIVCSSSPSVVLTLIREISNVHFTNLLPQYFLLGYFKTYPILDYFSSNVSLTGNNFKKI